MTSTRLGKKAKSLIIYDLNGVLGYMTKNYNKNAKGMGIYASGDLKVEPDYRHENIAIFKRPNLNNVIQDVIMKQRQLYDVGVWSSCGYEDTKLLIDKLFGRYYTQ